MKPALEKRTTLRKKIVLPLKSCGTGTPASCDAVVHTLDLSQGGARLGAFRDQVKPGDVLTVRRHYKRAKCKVIWTRQIGPHELQVGIELLGPEDGFWGVPLDEERTGVWTFASDRW